jgi:Fuc2NAc and GlcNAc transferase
MDLNVHTIWSLAISLALGAGGAILFARFGNRLGFLDRPDERSSHRVATPKGGGIGILAAFICLSIFYDIPAGFWIPAVLVSMVGLYTDWRDLSPGFRLLAHFIAALVLVVSLPVIEPHSSGQIFLIALCAIFIVGTANFYNFMDGINGIAGITAFMALGFMTVYLHLSGVKLNFMYLSGGLSLACLGFLPFNFPGARVFMGDVGSLLIGFVYAGLVIVLSQDLLGFLCLASFIFLFYADELTTMFVRLKDKESLLRPHRRHLYQILSNEYGVAHWKVSLGYAGVQFIIGTSILGLKSTGLAAVSALILFYFSGFSLFSFIIRRNLLQR